MALNVDSQSIDGNILVDDISSLDFQMSNNSVFTGSINPDGDEGKMCIRDSTTVDQAKTRTQGFQKDYFAVMRAFGLNDRRPAEPELVYMDKWFKEYGFTKKIIIEACGRTIEAIDVYKRQSYSNIVQPVKHPASHKN